MTRLHETIEVPRAISEAFRYTSDFSNIEQWDPGVSESSRLDAGPVGKGSRFRVVVKAGLSRVSMDYVITAYEPPRRVVLEGRGDGIGAIDEIRFSAVDGGTRIEYTADISLGGLAGLAQPVLGGACSSGWASGRWWTNWSG